MNKYIVVFNDGRRVIKTRAQILDMLWVCAVTDGIIPFRVYSRILREEYILAVNSSGDVLFV